MIHLDTHVVAWLFAGEVDRLPASLRERLDREEIRVSPMVVLELQYLFETGRTRRSAEEVVRSLTREIGLQVSEVPFRAVVERALSADWTRDPFDRLISSEAEVAGVRLATKDRTIRANSPDAIWD